MKAQSENQRKTEENEDYNAINQAVPTIFPVLTVLFVCCMCVFVLYSISRWLKTRQVCPLDNRDWEFQKYGR
jgi:hypothetical protein